MTRLTFHPLTPDRWDDFVALFETDSICRMCWCMFNRMTPDQRKVAPGAERKALMKKVVAKGEQPGLLAYKGGEAVGWLAIAPRPHTPEWNIGRKASIVTDEADAHDDAVWGATCFFVRKDARGEGVTTALLDAGIAHAKKNGASRVEACPMAHDEKRSTTGMFVGPKRVFDRAGFDTVIERKPGRPLMRLAVKKSAAKPATKKKPAPANKPALKTKARGK